MFIKGQIEQAVFQTETFWGVVVFKAHERYSAEILRACPEAFTDEGLAMISEDGVYFTATGIFPKLREGMELSLEGDFKRHQKYGWQFAVDSAVEVAPSTLEGIYAFLSSGLIEGVGEALAGRIISHFGQQTIAIFESNIDRLQEVDGIGAKTLEKIKRSWAETRQMQTFVSWFTEEAGGSTKLAIKLFTTFGGTAQQIIEQNPWRIAEVAGVGFFQADAIAIKLGHAQDSLFRIEAGLKFILQQAESPGGFNFRPSGGANQDKQQQVDRSIPGGQCFLPEPLLLEAAGALLAVPEALVKEGLARLAGQMQLTLTEQPGHQMGDVIIEQVNLRDGEASKAVYTSRTYRRETEAARRLIELLRHPVSRILTLVQTWDEGRWAQFFAGLEADGICLTDEQQTAIINALSAKVSVITGGPGCGKTFSMKVLVNWLIQQGLKVSLAAPTGRASKVLAQSTGQEAATIHRLLGFNGEQFAVTAFDSQKKKSGLDCDFLIIDETSMLDLWLLYHLLQRCPPRTHLLFVGDEDQLPSVGAGFVLGDMIASGEIPVSRLTKIHRQAESSAIVANAWQVNRGSTALIAKTADDERPDFFIAWIKDHNRLADQVVEMVTQKIPAKFAYQPQDIQVLAPRHASVSGTIALNRRLQAILNPQTKRSEKGRAKSKPAPAKTEHKTGEQTFRVGDFVMQTTNNYKKVLFEPWDDSGGYTSEDDRPMTAVFNGDQGYITGYEKNVMGYEVFVVEIDGHQLEYKREDLDKELVLSYVITIHKSQGGQFPVVVIPLTWQHYTMLSRKLLYTAITRAREMVVILTQPGQNGGGLAASPLGMAIQNNETSQRYTGLAWRLKNGE